ncbi:TetR family transcriptional regulator [Spiractinospora alimapuensis]|uniref:TetR/AcrR family transcriptional regulator n=1 Tax=Spiractinospora alimapuensis TaxID=2820884 RepID=UPI001F45B9DD|nr:TetR/AcrR family transcriptional regulator [Spiractinospora alimapuensis]QVQ53433.1 TetR family transcriptional regulator [Spiractinospora alimapuensis]
MRSENQYPGQEVEDSKKRSFIEEARRTQIIEAAIETLAEVGYADASLARIARTAGISKGVITYHFDGKDELIQQVVETVYLDIAGAVTPRVHAQPTAREALRTHLLEVARYMRPHRSRLQALGEIFASAHRPDADGTRRYNLTDNEPIYQGLEELLRWGQETGEFRAFDRRVLAVTFQGALDTMFAYWVAYPDHDLEDHAWQLAEIFDRATRAH